MKTNNTAFNYVPHIRCIAPPGAWKPERIELDEPESHHLVRVLRLDEGASVRVLDGEGRWTDGVIESARKNAVVISYQSVQTIPENRPKTVLVQSLIKHPRMEIVIQKMVELGVSELLPVWGDRSVVKEKARGEDNHQERMRAIALAALKQSCNYRLPVIHAPVPLEAAPASMKGAPHQFYGALEPDSRTFRDALRDIGADPETIVLYVGPEGDYTERERVLLRQAGVQPVSLGPTVLRSETAALYMLSAVRYEFDCLPPAE